MRILVVDDFGPFREFVCGVLLDRSAWVVCQASDGVEAVQQAQRYKPDVILLDIGLPRLNGIEAARQIRIVSPNSKIIFVSQETSNDIIEECLGLGNGYLVKGNAGSELQTAINAVLQGKQYVSRSLL